MVHQMTNNPLFKHMKNNASHSMMALDEAKRAIKIALTKYVTDKNAANSDMIKAFPKSISMKEHFQSVLNVLPQWFFATIG